jgi:hypothetical protein
MRRAWAGWSRGHRTAPRAHASLRGCTEASSRVVRPFSAARPAGSHHVHPRGLCLDDGERERLRAPGARRTSNDLNLVARRFNHLGAAPHSLGSARRLPRGDNVFACNSEKNPKCAPIVSCVVTRARARLEVSGLALAYQSESCKRSVDMSQET